MIVLIDENKRRLIYEIRRRITIYSIIVMFTIAPIFAVSHKSCGTHLDNLRGIVYE